MTNGEAIKLLMSMKDGIIHVFDGDRMVALEMAISALQAQDSTSNLVSKNVIKNQMIKYGFTAPDMTVTEFVEDCLPSAHLDVPDTNVGDMISRTAAIRIAEQGQIHGFPWQFEQLTKLPSAQQEPQWIPCSERLPEEDHWLGGSGKQFSDNVLVSIINSDDEDEWVDVSQTIDGEWALELPRYCKILAWMPLPEPYSAERRADA